MLGNEDGETRAGLTFGMTLPLWNRNRKAIAVAEGERQHARMEAVNEWKRLVSELERAKEVLRLAQENVIRCRKTEMPAALKLITNKEELYETGEMDVVAYAAAVQTIITAFSNMNDAYLALREAQINIGKFGE